MSYRSGYRSFKHKKIEGDEDCEVFLKALPEIYRVLKSDRHAYVFCSWHNIDIFKSAIAEHFTIKNLIVWHKNNWGAGDLKGSYAPMHELIIFAHKGRRELRGKRLPDVITHPKISGSKLVHPTEKPVGMLETFISASTGADEIVLDPFAGSGTTLKAAQNLGRRWLGIEMDDAYVCTAQERLKQ